MEKEKWIETELERMKEILSKNIDKLPQEEIPFMEPHLRAVYYQTFSLVLYGFYNASIVLSGIFLEIVTKERLFNAGIKDEELEEMDFGKAITECEKRKLLSTEEINFLKDKKGKVRNPYLHYNQIKLTKGRYFNMFKVSNPVEKITPLLTKVETGELTKQQAQRELIEGLQPETMDSTMFRPLAQIVKGQEDEKNAFEIFLEVDKFAREFAKKYFEPK